MIAPDVPTQCFILYKTHSFLNMRKSLLLIVSLIVSMGINAQSELQTAAHSAAQSAQKTVQTAVSGDSAIAVQPSIAYGYISYSEALKMMPEYAIAVQNEADLKASYEAEAKRVEAEFNAKYEEFLEGQRDFPETILKKRQTELQQLLERNIQFKAESQTLLEAAHKDFFAPVRAHLDEILSKIAIERGYPFILNTDNDALPFINPNMGVDLTADVLLMLQREAVK